MKYLAKLQHLCRRRRMRHMGSISFVGNSCEFCLENQCKLFLLVYVAMNQASIFASG